MKDVVPVAYRPPFQTLGYVDERPHGQTILEIVRSVPNLPPIFMQRGVVLINGEVVPQHMWACVRPKPTRTELPIAVTMHLPLAGGGKGSTGKTIIGLVAALALVVVTAGIGAGFAAPILGASFAAGTFGAAALAGAVGLAGALAISALTRPPTSGGDPAATSDTNTDQKEPASASGNVLEQGGPIPRVLGTRRIYPPLVGEPIVELVGDNEFVEAAFVLNGPHVIEDLRLDGVPIDSTDDVQFETRAGLDGDTPLTLTTRQGRTITPQLTLSEHVLDKNGTNGKELLHPGSPTDDLPIWHGFVSRKSPDEIWIHLQLPAGISVDADKNIFRAFPIRMRFRRRGDVSWINVPEFHCADSTVNPQRKAIIIKWGAFPGLVTPPANSGFVEAHFSPPVQASGGGTASPNSVVTWVANGWFDDGSGNEYLYSANTATKITNMNLFDNRVEIYLDADIIPKGIYEVQLMHGTQYQRNGGAWTVSTYKVAGVVYDFFYYNTSQIGVPAVSATMRNTTGSVIVTRFISIWNEYPIPVEPGDFALIAIKARNRSIQRLSCTAAGLIADWDGSGWNTDAVTSNPAAHYRDVLAGSLNKAPLPDYLIDNDSLVGWRTLCANHDWTCDAIVSDMRTQDVLSLLASCGYARPYQSEVYGVVVDTNREADAPIQVFSGMNAANVSYEKAFAQVPAGFIVTYRDEETDDDRAQTIVSQRDPTVATNDSYESISFDGLIDETKVQDRAQFDLDQANDRSTFYNLDTDIESLVCRKGDLVALQHDIISHWAGTARVKSKTFGGGSPPLVVGLILNSELPLAEGDVLPGVMIRHNDGTISTHTLSAMSGAQITFTTPIANSGIDAFDETDGTSGALVVSGAVSSEYKRMLVAGIHTTKDLKASLVLVDEAPDLIRHNAAFFFAGFETGDESELGGSSAGGLEIINYDSIEGTKAAFFDLGSGDAYRESTTGHNKTDVVLRFYYFYFYDTTHAETTIGGFSGSSDNVLSRIFLSSTGVIGCGGVWNSDVPEYQGYVMDPEENHLIEMRLIIAGGDQGAVYIVVDGELAYALEGITTNGEGNIDRSYISTSNTVACIFDAWSMTVPF